MYQIYCDASMEPVNPGGICAWAYIVKENGERIHEDVRIAGWGDKFTNNIGEYLAVMGAMLWLIRLPTEKHDAVTLMSDSQLVINHCAGKWTCRDPKLLPLYTLIKDAETRYKRNIKFHWIPRDKNQEADALSRSLYTEKMLKIMEDHQLELTFGDDDIPF